jgi:hypothetical protein
MATDLRSLLLSSRAPAPASQRANARRLIEGCWVPIWRGLESRLPEVLLESLGPLAKDENPDVAKPAKLVIVRDRRFCAEYEIALKIEFARAVEEFVGGRAAEKSGEKAAERPADKPAGKDAGKPAAKSTGGLGSGLSLVGYGDMELSTMVEASASRVRNAADDIYSSILIRLANAVGEAEIRAADSPFKPALFFRALHTALTRLDAVSADTVMQLMPRFDAHLVKPIADAYQGIDAYLSAKGLGNELSRTTVFRNTAASRNTRLGGGTQGRASQFGGVGGVAGAHAEQILQALYSRLQLLPTDGAPAGSGGVGPGGPATGAAYVAGATRPMLNTVAGLTYGLPTGLPSGLSTGLPPGVSVGAGGVPTAMQGTPTAMQGIPTLAGLPAISGVPLLPGTEQAGAAMQPAGAMATASMATVALPGAPLVIGVDLLNAINEIQKLSAVALTAAQHGRPAPDAAIETAELRNRLIEKATAQVDKLTIEIVGLLFERINADKHVPQPIKELLQRLQFPLIKVAVTDPALFVSADQPARRLMDRIASTSIGWTGEGESNSRYLAEVQKAIHTVLAATDEGITVFERALQEFEAYLDDERTRDDDPVIRAKRALAEAEEREVLAINATIKIRSAFDGVQLESYMREFLLETWVRVLVAVTIRDRGEDSALRRYLGIVPDLVWSVQPKLSHDERKRLVGIIPSVLGALREGLMVIDFPTERMQEFFGKLMNSHAQAVKALELAHGSPGVPFEPSTMRIKLDGLRLDDITPPPTDTPVHVPDERVRQALASAKVDVDHLAPPSTSQTIPAARDDLSDEALEELIAGWKRGDWFNLRLGDVVERVQLRWVSPRRTLYLFMPAEKRSGHSLSPESLRAYLRSGDLAPVEDEPLFDRAVQDVVYELQRAAPTAVPVA